MIDTKIITQFLLITQKTLEVKEYRNICDRLWEKGPLHVGIDFCTEQATQSDASMVTARTRAFFAPVSSLQNCS